MALYLQEYNVLAKFRRKNRLARLIFQRGVLVLGLCCLRSGWAATVSIVPEADSFLRSFAPTSNYGAGGALSVSGSAAVNSTGDQNGLFDTLMRFPMSNVVATLDASLGGHDWVVTRVQLLLTEMATPDNAIFNRGVGAFEVRWIANDQWLEGTGKPMSPTTDGVAWQDLPLILNSNIDRSLGVFTNAGANDQLRFTLGMPESFLVDLRTGDELSLYLRAASPAVGFTFSSRNFGNTNAQPALEVTALANPKLVIDSVTAAGENLSVAFNVTTNWAYRLQRSYGLESATVWADVLTIPPQATPTNVVYVEGMTNGRAFYRLSVSASP